MGTVSNVGLGPPHRYRQDAFLEGCGRCEDPCTAAYDGQMALGADELQHERDHGPCVDAERSLSVPLPFPASTIGALNDYSTAPHAFHEDDGAVGEEVANMRSAVVSRGTIEQARCILMERFKCREAADPAAHAGLRAGSARPPSSPSRAERFASVGPGNGEVI